MTVKGKSRMNELSVRSLNLVAALATGLCDRIENAMIEGTSLAGESGAALSAIGHSPGLSIEQLRHIIGLSHPGTVRLVDRLSQLGFIHRKPAKLDKRVATIHLTDSGIEARREMLGRRRDAIAHALRTLDRDESKFLVLLAEKLLKNIPTDLTTSLNVCRFCEGDACSNCPMGVYGALGVPEPEASLK
jgi:DNA-binding MarR family transcriptional regulator